MAVPRAPLVSIAIPLCRSKQFLSVIMANIEALGDEDLEILVSDRHGDDDALESLRKRYADDPRFRWSSARDRLRWTDHYNYLLREARGRYFMWMPHDDSFPAGYVPTLVAALEDDPAAVLAFGAIDAVDLDGVAVPGWRFQPPPFQGARATGVGDSIRLLFWGGAMPFRGVFRRDQAVARDLYLRPDARAADGAWVFALSLTGVLRYVPRCRSVKRYYSWSTSAAPYRVRDVLRDGRALRACLRESALSRRDRMAAAAGLALWQAVRLAGRVVPVAVRPSGSRTVYRLLPRGLRPGQQRFPTNQRRAP